MVDTSPTRAVCTERWSIRIPQSWARWSSPTVGMVGCCSIVGELSGCRVTIRFPQHTGAGEAGTFSQCGSAARACRIALSVLVPYRGGEVGNRHPRPSASTSQVGCAYLGGSWHEARPRVFAARTVCRGQGVGIRGQCRGHGGPGTGAARVRANGAERPTQTVRGAG